ncbi:hypothetical protein J6590_078680 [Homalodisca vitripennis]|nr:hypothetical protein J6590_078680 [Homalodisca vitripennis]
MRHDLPQLDLKISIINSKIERLAENFPNLQLLPLHLLPRHVFTAHGLHFNMKGKARIADMVSKLKQMKGTSHNVPRQPKNQTHPFSIPSCKITVLETDINQLMDHFQNDQSVTGATVCIVSYEQPTAQRQLWRGLTHNEFVRTLRKQLAEHQAQKQQLDISPSSQSPLSGEVVVLSDIGLSVDTFASCLSLTDTPTLSQNISLTDSPTSSQNTFLTKTPTKLQNVSPTNTSSTNVTGNSVDLN